MEATIRGKGDGIIFASAKSSKHDKDIKVAGIISLEGSEDVLQIFHLKIKELRRMKNQQTKQSKEEYAAPVVIKHDALKEMTGLQGYHYHPAPCNPAVCLP